ncbi:MAG: hypothetical protein ACOYM3_09285 [Terrimicrobiaceae bacterium]
MNFMDRRSPRSLLVSQPVSGLEWTELIYPDQPSFLSDGRSFVFQSSEGPQVCYLGKKVRTRRLFNDKKPREFVVTFDGRFAYYAESDKKGRGCVTLFRKDLETFRCEKLFHARSRLPGTNLPAAEFVPRTVSADNRRVGLKRFLLVNRRTKYASFGVAVLDLDNGQTRMVTVGRDVHNPHLQYCRSTDPERSHDLLIQMNHGARFDERGCCLHGLGPPSDLGTDLHVVRDDGTNWRDLPFGRDGRESLIGHQVWRGETGAVAAVTLQNLDTSYGWAEGTRQDVVSGWPVKASRYAHKGCLTPSGRRVLLSKGFPRARFCHLNCDASGLRFALDTFPIFDGKRAGMQVFFGRAKDLNCPLKFTYLLNSGLTFLASDGATHAHPILSPDGSMLFFNSRASGARQFYMVTGFEA